MLLTTGAFFMRGGERGFGLDPGFKKSPGAIFHDQREPDKFDWIEFEQPKAGSKDGIHGWTQ
jgi:hypothetical protein